LLNKKQSPGAWAAAAATEASHADPADENVRAEIPRSLSVAIFGLLLLCYAYVHQDYSGGTPTSRLDLLQALVLHGTFSIDQYHRNTSDKALFDGHYYSDKAPGTAVLALPAFALAQLLLKLEGGVEDTISGWRSGDWLLVSWLATVGSVGLITALGGASFFVWLCR
jgi:hypothetical protein